MLHEKVRYKKSEWPKFNEAMKALISESYELVELSIIDHGDFKFRPQYQHLAKALVSNDTTTTATSSFKGGISITHRVQQCNCTDNYKELPETEEPETQVLSLSVQDAGIESLPKPIVNGIWNKINKKLKI